MRRLRRSAARAAAASNGVPNASTSTTARFDVTKRIPSWNCIARENSSGSLEDEAVSSTQRNRQNKQNSQDGSDSDSESASGSISWTRSGGPLMRTTSADEFVEYFKTASGGDIDPGYGSQFFGTETSNQDSSTEDFPVPVPVPVPENGISRRNSGGSAEFDRVISSRIMVAEGDFLQTEKHPDGILFNVVKKDTLTTTTTTTITTAQSNPTSELAECLQIDDVSGKDLDLDPDTTTPEGSDHEHEAAEGQQNQADESQP